MSFQNFPGAHEILERLKSNDFVHAVTMVKDARACVEDRRLACAEIFDHLNRAPKGANRNAGLDALIRLLIELRDLKTALEAVESIDSGSELFPKRPIYRELLEQAADVVQEGIRVGLVVE